jgi:predicted ATP-grasp superfamily ATP-dependent carboligase
MFRTLVTDGDWYYSVAIQKYLKKGIQDIQLIVHTSERSRLARYYHFYDSLIEGVPLERALADTSIDMVIPVGPQSVRIVDAQMRDKAVLPPPESVKIAFDKARTAKFAKDLGIAVPTETRLDSIHDLKERQISFPCVVKPGSEIDGKFVFRATNREQLAKAVQKGFTLLGPASQSGLLVQQWVGGKGAAFWCLYQAGEIKRVFMHHKIREWPVLAGRQLTAGQTTACRAVDDPHLYALGRSLMDKLSWHGVAEVEFMHDAKQERYVLMEINAKFWAPIELALCSGINFPADLVRVFRGEMLEFNREHSTEAHFYWPLDGDLLILLKTRQLGRVMDYFSPLAQSNMLQSPLADLVKTTRLSRKVVSMFLGR